MIDTVVTVGVLLALLVLVFRLIRGSGAQLTPFSLRRARTAMSSPTGRNAVTVLAVLQLAQLGLQLSDLDDDGLDGDLIGAVIVCLLLGVLIALVVAERSTGVLLTVVGLTAGLVSVYLRYGTSGVVLLTVVSMVLLWLLGLVRGLVSL